MDVHQIVASTFHLFYGALRGRGHAADAWRSRVVVASIATWSLATLPTGFSTRMAHLRRVRASLPLGGVGLGLRDGGDEKIARLRDVDSPAPALRRDDRVRRRFIGSICGTGWQFVRQVLAPGPAALALPELGFLIERPAPWRTIAVPVPQKSQRPE